MTEAEPILSTVADNGVTDNSDAENGAAVDSGPQKFGTEPDIGAGDLENDLDTVDEVLQALDSEDLESAELLAAQLRGQRTEQLRRGRSLNCR